MVTGEGYARIPANPRAFHDLSPRKGTSMFTATKLRSPAQGEAYFIHEDYYNTDADPRGQWIAGDMGLDGHEVNREMFHRVLNGFHPVTGSPLASDTEDRIPAWDGVQAVPKSASALWALADIDEAARIEQDVLDSAKIAMQFLSEHAGEARRGHNGIDHEPVRLNSALFLHSTSRNLDPHLHVHSVIANLAQRSDGSWGAIDSRPIYRWAKATGTVFQTELAYRLAQRGYVIAAGDHGAFRVIGVPEELTKAWSSRHEDIDMVVDAAGLSSAASRDIAQKQTRMAKRHVGRNTLRARWHEEGRARGWDRVQLPMRDAASEPVQLDRSRLFETLTEHNSTFDERQLYIAVCQQSYGTRDFADVQGVVGRLLQDPEIIRTIGTSGPRFTTQAMIDLEHDTTARLSQLAQRHTPPMRVDLDDAGLSKDQAQAVHHLLSQPGHLHILTGPAGSGKSHTLAAARGGWEQRGYRVVGAAVAAKAAQVLSEEAHIPSHTIAHLLRHGISQGKPTVLVVDEASMIDTRDFAALVELVHTRDAHLVLVGDPEQLPAIGPGGMFRASLDVVEPARLTTMRRQEDVGARKATRAFAVGDARTAMAWFTAAGAVHTASAAELLPAMVDDWLSDYGVGTQLMVASSRRQAYHLNRLARQGLQLHGLLLPDQYQVSTAFGDRAVSIGDRLLLRQNEYRHYDVRNGDRGTVTDLHVDTQGDLVVRFRLDDGRLLWINPSEYPHFDWAYATTLHQAQGQTVDRAYWLVSLTDQDTHAYVATSRARSRTDLYIAADEWAALDRMADQEYTLQRVAQHLARPGQKHLAIEDRTLIRQER